MDVAFIENTQDDVHGYERGQNQDGLVRKRAKERGGSALERGLNAWWHSDLIFDGIDGVHRFAQRSIRGEVKGQRDYGKLPLVIDG